MSPWKPEELNRLPRWFQAHKRLKNNQIEARFAKDFGRFRTHGAIMAAYYRARREHGKRRIGLKQRLQPGDSPPSTANEPARVAIPNRIDSFSPTSNSGPRPSASFLAPLRSLRSPGIWNGGTPEKQRTKLSHRTRHIKPVTPRDTTERALWDDCSFISASGTGVEQFDPASTAVLNPEQTTRDGRSSRGDLPSIQPTDTREGNKSNRDVQGVYDLTAPAVAPEARSPTRKRLGTDGPMSGSRWRKVRGGREGHDRWRLYRIGRNLVVAGGAKNGSLRSEKKVR
ncbi:hypothetical protein P170DRAFT_437877, partial [Aspergillus steynii IBT 23096]